MVSGVLRTEIHPTQPKVTVTGNVNAQILIKKLAKVGKSAELLLEEAQKPQEGEKSSQASDEKMKKPNKKGKEEREGGGGGGSSSSDKLPEPVSKGNSSGDGDSRAREREEACGCEATRSVLPTVVAAIPPGMVQDSSLMAAAHARVYYPVAVPVQYYSVDSYAAHPHHCVQEHYCLETPANRPPPMQSQATAFGDYFNDDNTVGCSIM